MDVVETVSDESFKSQENETTEESDFDLNGRIDSFNVSDYDLWECLDGEGLTGGDKIGYDCSLLTF